jgi:hypothetical protein
MKRKKDDELHTGEASTEAAIFDLDAYRKDDAIRRRFRVLMSLAPGSTHIRAGQSLRESRGGSTRNMPVAAS